jgi:hypothetical protein
LSNQLLRVRDVGQEPQKSLLEVGKLVRGVGRRIAVEIDAKLAIVRSVVHAMDMSSTGPFVRLCAVADARRT